jgi:hypothetical protein
MEKEYRVKFIDHEGDIIDNSIHIIDDDYSLDRSIEEYAQEFLDEDDIYDIETDLIDAH